MQEQKYKTYTVGGKSTAFEKNHLQNKQMHVNF